MSLTIYNPNGQPVGLGFRLFGKNHSWGSIAKSICNAAAKAIGGYIDAVTLGVFSASDRMTEAVNQIFPAAKGLTVTADDLTQAEQAIIQPWIDNKFTPYVKMLTNDLAAGIKLTDNAAKILVLNTVENKINTIQDHYAVAETLGLSQTAIVFRQFLIATLLEPLHNIVLSTVANIPVNKITVTFNPAIYSFAPLFSTTPITSVSSENYKLASGGGFATIGTTTTPTTTQSPAVTGTGVTVGNTLPAVAASAPKPTVTFTTTPGVVDLINKGTTVVQTQAQVATNNAAIAATKAAAIPAQSNTALYIGGGLVAVTALYLATRKKKNAGLAGGKAKMPAKRKPATKRK